MKNFLLPLLLLFLFVSCSKDEPEPDLTGDFVGTWVSDPLYAKDYTLNSTWNLSKESNNKIKIVINSVMTSPNGSFAPSEDVTIISGIEVTDTRTFAINQKETSGGETSTYEGSGVMTGSSLTVIIKTTTPRGLGGTVKYELRKRR